MVSPEGKLLERYWNDRQGSAMDILEELEIMFRFTGCFNDSNVKTSAGAKMGEVYQLLSAIPMPSVMFFSHGGNCGDRINTYGEALKLFGGTHKTHFGFPEYPDGVVLSLKKGDNDCVLWGYSRHI
jgi:hypothetical protein